MANSAESDESAAVSTLFTKVPVLICRAERVKGEMIKISVEVSNTVKICFASLLKMGLLQEEQIGAQGETTLMTCCLLSCTSTPPETMSIPRRRKFFPFRADPFSAGSKNNWSSLPPLTVRVNQFPLLRRKAMICMSSCVSDQTARA